MNEDRTTYASNLFTLVDYDVVDRNNKKIGTVDSVWEDSTGLPAFLSIRTGWLGLGRSHFVPAHSAEVSERGKTIRLPYDEDTVKKSPDFDAKSDLDEGTESNVYDYYRTQGMTFPEEGARDWSTAAPQAEYREGTAEKGIQLKEEQLHVGKKMEDAGGVRLRKVIRTETVNQPVELQREEIEIERVPASSEHPADTAFGEGEMYIPLRRERPEVSKTTRATEEIRAHKTTERDQETLSETLRKEDIEVEKE